jgi:hypothetical protein
VKCLTIRQYVSSSATEDGGSVVAQICPHVVNADVPCGAPPLGSAICWRAGGWGWAFLWIVFFRFHGIWWVGVQPGSRRGHATGWETRSNGRFGEIFTVPALFS